MTTIRQALIKSKVMYEEEREEKEKEKKTDVYNNYQNVMQIVVSATIKNYVIDFVNFLYSAY